jgi:HEAT repeat protein
MESHIYHTPVSMDFINNLIELLDSRDPSVRKEAQNHLAEIGRSAVPALMKLTNQPKSELRWEAAYILGDIGDPMAIPTLIALLVDEAFEVRWRAAESLIKMNRASIIPLFQELQHENRFESVWFMEGVHHILRKLDEIGYLGLPSQGVLEAFNHPSNEIAVPEAAEKALEALSDLDEPDAQNRELSLR